MSGYHWPAPPSLYGGRGSLGVYDVVSSAAACDIAAAAAAGVYDIASPDLVSSADRNYQRAMSGYHTIYGSGSSLPVKQFGQPLQHQQLHHHHQQQQQQQQQPFSASGFHPPLLSSDGQLFSDGLASQGRCGGGYASDSLSGTTATSRGDYMLPVSSPTDCFQSNPPTAECRSTSRDDTNSVGRQGNDCDPGNDADDLDNDSGNKID